MDNSVVTRLIRQVIWRSLTASGFSTFTGRYAWRHWDEGIDIVNIQAYGPAYHPELFVAPTSYSFAVNLGVWFDYIPNAFPREIDERGGVSRPAEYQCQLRRRLQRDQLHPAYPVPEFWYIEPDGSNTQAMIEDAREVILRDGLPWLERFHSSDEVLRTFHGEYGGIAAAPPIVAYNLAYAARRTGDDELAVAAFEKVLASGLMRNVEDRVASDLRDLRGNS